MADDAPNTSESAIDKAALANAEAAKIEAEVKRTEANYHFVDRFIMRGLIPFALAVAAPAATWWLDRRATANTEAVQSVAVTLRDLRETVTTLKASIDTLRIVDEQRHQRSMGMLNQFEHTMMMTEAKGLVRERGLASLTLAANDPNTGSGLPSVQRVAVVELVKDYLDVYPEAQIATFSSMVEAQISSVAEINKDDLQAIQQRIRGR